MDQFETIRLPDYLQGQELQMLRFANAPKEAPTPSRTPSQETHVDTWWSRLAQWLHR